MPRTTRNAVRVLSAGLLFAALALPVAAGDDAGSLIGWVEDSRGAPVAGAVVSLFAKGMPGGGLVAFSDEAGRFVLPSLPAGSYTVRAIGLGRPASARKITVLPNEGAILALSLPGLGELSEKEAAERRREWNWLLRHKARSVLEQRETATVEAEDGLLDNLTPWLPELGGSVELMASASAFGHEGQLDGSELLPGGTGALRLRGRLGDVATFTLGGLVAEREDTSWRMATEWLIEPDDEHDLRVGAGYGTRYVRPLASDSTERLEGGTVGALFASDTVEVTDWLSLTAGARQTYIGFVQDRNHLDPMAAVEWRPGRNTSLRASAEGRTLVPGGDLLTLSTLAAAPAIVYAETTTDLRAERILRYEIAAERSVGATRVGLRVFRESARDQLVNAFIGPGSSRTLRIFNAGSTNAHGTSLDVSHRLGRVFQGTIEWTWGRAGRDVPVTFLALPDALGVADGRFHDLSGRIETFIPGTDTRLVARYRINLLRPESGERRVAAMRNDRFDVQLTQGLPYIGGVTRADWDLLVAVRNMFYEPTEGMILDELAVANPPTRVMGGISVRF